MLPWHGALRPRRASEAFGFGLLLVCLEAVGKAVWNGVLLGVLATRWSVFSLALPGAGDAVTGESNVLVGGPGEK